jgi:chemotaxis-related protein WspB
MLAVTFRVAGAGYALRCDGVVAVIPEVELRPVAQGAAWLRGMFAFRGELTPVVDLCQLIAGYRCPARLSSRIALVRCEPLPGVVRVLGLLAEHMTEARRVQGSSSKSAPMAALPYFSEVLLEQGEPLQFVEPTAILQASGLALAEPSTAPRIGA